MKKIKLDSKNLLNKEQLREIKGGYDCGDPNMCGGNSYWSCTDSPGNFPGDIFMNCIGGTYYSCTYAGPSCVWHPGSN